MNTDTILGIDPGTRFVGIAVLRNGTLVHYQIRSFQGPWTYKKLKAIILLLGATVARYGVTKIVVKVPDVFPTSPGYNQLIGAFNVFCRSKGLRPCYYSFSDITERHCASSEQSRGALIQVIVRKHPELIPEYKKEQDNENAHYHKLFYAVAATHMP
jgi:hypothetical protein